MGFRPGEKFERMFFILWSTCTADNEFKMETQVLDTERKQFVWILVFLENGKNVMNFKSKCEEWLNEWEASLDLSEIEIK